MLAWGIGNRPGSFWARVRHLWAWKTSSSRPSIGPPQCSQSAGVSPHSRDSFASSQPSQYSNRAEYAQLWQTVFASRPKTGWGAKKNLGSTAYLTMRKRERKLRRPAWPIVLLQTVLCEGCGGGLSWGHLLRAARITARWRVEESAWDARAW